MLNRVDIYVGKKLRLQRMMLGITQKKVGEAIGVTFQQVQKYESGVNRISAGQLYELSQYLNVPVSYFYEGYNNRINISEIAEISPEDNNVSLLVNSYIKLPQTLRGKILLLVKSIVKSEE